MTGHTPWAVLRDAPRCRRCRRRRKPDATWVAEWCRPCTREVCCDNHPRLVPNGVFYDRWGKAWPAFRWVDCVHHNGRVAL